MNFMAFLAKRAQSKLLLIDSSPLVIKGAKPKLDCTANNQHGSANHGLNYFVRTLFKKILYLQPTHICVALDNKLSNQRRLSIDDSYKTNRKSLEKEIIDQLEQIQTVCNILNIANICYDGHESDDILYSYAKSHRNYNMNNNNNYETHIVSGDKDLFVLLNDPNVIIHRLIGIDSSKINKISQIYKERVTPVSIDTSIIDPYYSDSQLFVETTNTNNTNNNNNNSNSNSSNQSIDDNYTFSHKMPSYYGAKQYNIDINSRYNNPKSVDGFNFGSFGVGIKPTISENIKTIVKSEIINNNDNNSDSNDNNDTCYDIEWSITPNKIDCATHGLLLRCPNAEIDTNTKIPIKKMDIRPSQFGIFLAITGDNSDGISGCPKIGLKRAKQLLDAFPQIVCFKTLLQNIDAIKTSKILSRVIINAITDQSNLKIVEKACKLIDLQDISQHLPPFDYLTLDYDKLYQSETSDKLRQINVELPKWMQYDSIQSFNP